MITVFDRQPSIGFCTQIFVGKGPKFEYGSARHPSAEIIRGIFFLLIELFNISQAEALKKINEGQYFLGIGTLGNFLQLGRSLYVQFIATNDQESFGINYYVPYKNFNAFKWVFKRVQSQIPIDLENGNRFEFSPLQTQQWESLFDLSSPWISTPKNDPQGWPPLK